MTKPTSPGLEGFVITDVHDPAEMDERSLMSRRLPGHSVANTYTLRDPALRRSGKSLLLTRHANRQVGGLGISHVAERFGTRAGIIEPGVPAHCFCLVRSGHVVLSTQDAGRVAEAGRGEGLIRSGEAGTWAVTSDGTMRTNVWIGADRFNSALQALLGERLRAPLIFAPTLNFASASHAGLRRLMLHAIDEMPRPGGLASNALALAAFIDLFVHTAVRTLPNSYAERLDWQKDGAVPATVYQALEYFRAHAEEAVRMEDVAVAAGCSVRALQRGFRHFCDTTPHAALERVRLELARAALVRDEADAAAVARRYGFTNMTRFATAYARLFGKIPPGTRRRTSASSWR